MRGNPILMIEDDDGHARLIERHIRRAGVENSIQHCRDGASALNLLFEGESRNGTGHYPALVFLDLNLPDMNGTDILRRIKGDAHLRRLVVVVLTTTDNYKEIDLCYDLGCNAYLTKPLKPKSFGDLLSRLGQFISVMQMPEPVQY